VTYITARKPRSFDVGQVVVNNASAPLASVRFASSYDIHYWTIFWNPK